MAQDSGTQLTAVWFLASFLWLSYSSQRHSLINQPRLSSFLLLFITGVSAFVTSVFSKWLPGADGRFDSDAILKASPSSLPPRPRRFYIPCIIVLIVLRLELYHKILYDFQCSSAGIEAFLPLILATYRLFSFRPPPVEADELEDPWRTPLDDLKAWLAASPPILLLFSTALLSYGSYLASGFVSRSTYFCSSSLDRPSYIVFLQWSGVFIDATIILLSWRVLSWARTTKSRLRTLGSIMLTTSFATCIPSIIAQLSRADGIGHPSLRGIGALYVFDTLSTGVVIATLVITASLLMCDPSPLELTAVATLVAGTSASIGNVLLVGTYQQTSMSGPLFVQSLIATGFALLTYQIGLNRVAFMKRIVLILLLFSILTSSATYAVFKTKTFNRHPVDELVYQGRIGADRWLRHAGVSTTLKAAVNEYRERYGRDPPRGFDQWFEFALQRKSVVIDRFDQIERDVFPFWGLRAQQIRERLDFILAQPNVGAIRIINGVASQHGAPPDRVQQQKLDGISVLISSCSKHLPDMFIPINLQEGPRILVPWNDIHQIRMAATNPGVQLFPHKFGKRDGRREIQRPGLLAPPENMDPVFSRITAHDFRQLEALACPPGSPMRGGVHWDVRDFCGACVVPHSRDQFLEDWHMSLNPCHQPDMLNLHEFHTTTPQSGLYSDLLPLFSPSKTSLFNDIVVPAYNYYRRVEKDGNAFNMKQNVVFWQGDAQDIPEVTHESIHGSHRLRALHLVNNSTARNSVGMLLGVGAGKDSKFRYEDVPTSEGNDILPIQMSLIDPSAECKDTHCRVLREEFGVQEPIPELDNRYILSLDRSNGPPENLIRVLRSNSVPVVSTIFTEWFTERLMPWVHFIPMDLRYHAFHSTMAYFIGLDKRGKLNGREQITPNRKDDAEWIAEQGRKWADKAMRREDMEVYWFRLLLEWARVIDDDRDEMGFKLQS